jgi:formate hydrogenlyase subunit 3/multisubunit Na+/H+ antiporter MnhD subunit
MTLLLLALAAFLIGGLAAALASKSPVWATRFGVGGAVVGSLLGLIPSLRVLLGGTAVSLRIPWAVPYGMFYVEIDLLSAFFLLPILLLSALAAIYGGAYLSVYQDKKSLGPPWCFFNLLVMSMALVVIARNAILFMMAWEVMALASFFLVTFDDEHPQVREAGWTYLVATHLGAAFVLALFILLGGESGTLNFDTFGVSEASGASLANLAFLLAVIGFGTKAGFLPFHVWLPEAHPAAPSHVSAVMSGVMIKTGIYGLLRTLMFLGPPPLWWGYVLVGIGLTSGVLGVMFALAQHDLKRLLAYHSVENIGIIALGIGVGLIGISVQSPALAALGFAGGLLHVLNHALFKGLLFLGAGAVAHAAHTRDIDHLGGLLKRMPWTGATFLIGAAAISGLPPLNGFISEFLIYLGAYQGVALSQAAAVPLLGTIAGLALIGGLAAACFTKAFGIIFSGEPRSLHAEHAREAGAAMRLPMALLAAGCVIIGLAAPAVLHALTPVVFEVTRLSSWTVETPLLEAGRPLTTIVLTSIGLLALILALAAVRRRLLAGRRVEEAVTWDCGYALPSARMQYTASSFASPLTDLFDGILRTRRTLAPPAGLFPEAASLTTDTPDTVRDMLYRPVFQGIGWTLARLRWLQHGRIQLYVLYIALTILALLVWQMM